MAAACIGEHIKALRVASMQILAQCVLIRMQTKVAGNSVSPTSVFSDFTVLLLSSIHPSSCGYPEKQLHIAASSPPPVSNTKMTFTSSTCRKMGWTEAEWYGEKKERMRGRKCGDVINKVKKEKKMEVY